MRAVVVVFPGSNCDRDVAVALARCTGRAPDLVWHGATRLPACDLVVLPGGFSYGDYLRAGAIAAHAPIMRAVRAAAGRGTAVLGICNGFQILTETGLLPGALVRNAGLRFVCRPVDLRVDGASPFLAAFAPGERVRFPVAHMEGNYQADAATVARLEGDGRVALRYVDADGRATAAANPNGSAAGIAAVTSADRRILGLMPHPERVIGGGLGGSDGRRFFAALADALA